MVARELQREVVKRHSDPRPPRGFLNGKPIELWEGARMVSWCELIEGKIVMLRPDELRRA